MGPVCKWESGLPRAERAIHLPYMEQGSTLMGPRLQLLFLWKGFVGKMGVWAKMGGKEI